MPTGYYQNNKKNFKKRLVKGIKIILKKKKRKTKSVDILVKGIKIFLKKKTKNSIVVSIIKIFLKMTNKNLLSIQETIKTLKK